MVRDRRSADKTNPFEVWSEAVTKKNWSLGGKFIRMEGVWKPAMTEFFSLVSYDSATKEYRTWYFDSAGGQPRGSVRETRRGCRPQ